MAKVYDVPADVLIGKLANILKNEDIPAPSWIPFVKTGAHADKPPQDREWWYARCASLMRKIYLNGPIGINELRNDIRKAFESADIPEKFKVTVLVKGGGVASQADAVSLGIARALEKFDPELRGVLKKDGLLKRDARVKERKKPGLKKARKASQWSKR